MPAQTDSHSINSDLMPHRLIMGSMALSLAVAVTTCIVLGENLQQHWPEDRIVALRTVGYVLAILGFPLTNLIRHVQVRLCQTMPGSKPAKSRYLSAVIVSMALVESIGIMGILIFLLGDGYNTLYIFSGLAALGFVLYRPKASEYLSIAAALRQKNSGANRPPQSGI